MTVSSFLKQKWRTKHLALVEIYITDSILSLRQITPTFFYDILLSYKVIAQLYCLQEFAYSWMNGCYESNPGQTHPLVRILWVALVLDYCVYITSTQDNKTSNNKLMNFTSNKKFDKYFLF